MIRKLTKASAILALAVICAASFGLMMGAAHTDSAIDDELAHIPSGYGYVSQFDYRLNPEHPPLIKALAELPVLIFVRPIYPTDAAAWTKEINGQWDMGTEFLYRAGNDAAAIIDTSRIMPIFIMLFVIVLIWAFARRTMGNLWALLPAFLFAFDPAALAHGHYVTTDVGAAFGVLLSSYFFLRYVERPSTKHLWHAGIAFGIAQLAKFSTPLLVPLYIFIFIVLWLRDVVTQWGGAQQKFRKFGKALWQKTWKLAVMFVIGYAVIVYPVYFAFTAGEPIARQAADTTTILASFATGPTPAGQICKGIRCLADLDIFMSKHAITRPIAEYMLGVLMVIQRADGGNTIYFLGQIRGSGGWAYFPILFLLKEPIPTLVIVLFALILALWWIFKHTLHGWMGTGHSIKERVLAYLHLNIAEFTMASFVVLYWGYSMRSPLNIGIRHLMPTIPFIFILAAGIWKKWIMRLNVGGFSFSIMDSARAIARALATALSKYALLVLLAAWLVVETFSTAPYFLSYFNEFGGGTMGGYHFVTDSNYDWGQDLARLQQWTEANPQVDLIAVDYFGGGNPKYYIGGKEVDWSSSKGNPANYGIHWLAVSVNTLEGAIQPLTPGQHRNPADSYSWLTALRPTSTDPGTWLGGSLGNVPAPDYRIGTSIFVYHL